VTVELKMLGWCVLLGLAHVFIAAGLATQQRGLKWNASNRDGEPKPLTGGACLSAALRRSYYQLGAGIFAVREAKDRVRHQAGHPITTRRAPI
jgi:uncharacterized MAPEG superfamily protein